MANHGSENIYLQLNFVFSFPECINQRNSALEFHILNSPG